MKSKKLRSIARNAALSALIVSAIVGTGVVASAADNLSTISVGQVVTTPATAGTVGGLWVNGGTLYVQTEAAANSGKGYVVSGKNVAGTTSNVLISGGSLVIGKSNATTAANGAKLTVDNMTIAGGVVDVTNSSTLASKGSIDIMAGGTLQATAGLQNTVTHGLGANNAVNLRGGTIKVASDAALTIAGEGYTPANGEKGSLTIADKGRFNSYGGTINAGLVVKGSNTTPSDKGKASFVAGTTTVDNLTVAAGGSTLITGNATLNVLQDKATIKDGGTVDMKGGTLRVKGGEGTLEVAGSLNASLGMNTVDAKVSVDATGKVKVSNDATLTITNDLSVAAGGAVTVSGSDASLILKKGLTTAAGDATAGTAAITVGGESSPQAPPTKGSLTVGHGVVVGSTVGAQSIKLVSGGTLILTGYDKANFDLKDDNVDPITGKTQNGELGGDYSLNNIVIWGKELVGTDGKIVEAKTDGVKNITAGVNVKIDSGTAGTTPTLTGDVVAPSITTNTGSLDVTGGTLSLIGVGMGDASNKTTTLQTLTVTTNTEYGIVTVSDGARLVTDTTILNSGGRLELLNSTANIGMLGGTGGNIFVDPAKLHIAGVVDDKLTSNIWGGAGSVITVGGIEGWATKAMADAGFVFGDTTKATIGFAPTNTIDLNSKIVIDPTLAKSSNTYTMVDPKDGTTKRIDFVAKGKFWAGDNTLTVLDVSGLDSATEAVFDLNTAGAQRVDIVNGAKLRIANLTVKGVQIFENSTAGGSVVIGDGLGNIYNPADVNAGWTGKNLMQPDRMLTNIKMSDTGKLTADAALASSALGMSTEFNGLMHGVWGNALNNTNSANAGIRFVSRAASTDFGLTTHEAAKAIEGSAQLAAVAGVQGVTMSAANAATSAVATRTSFAQPLLDKNKAVAMHIDTDGSVSLDAGLSAGSGMKNGVALWIMPLYQSNNVWGMDTGNFQSGYMSDLGGIALGADYTVNDMFRFGAALNIGAGYSQSAGDFSSTDNNFNFWGVNLYGGWTMNNFGVTADVGYTGNYNKVEQDAPSVLGMPNFKSDINSSAWTAGLRGEYKFETAIMDIVPHVGVRYMGLTTQQYDVKSAGTIFDVEENFQSIWTFPIGVTMSKNIETGSGWVFKPQLDLAVIPAAGDVEAKSKSRITGAPGIADAKMQVLDYVTYEGGVGFDFGNDNLSFGVNYNIQLSEHRTGHGVFGTVRYEF